MWPVLTTTAFDDDDDDDVRQIPSVPVETLISFGSISGNQNFSSNFTTLPDSDRVSHKVWTKICNLLSFCSVLVFDLSNFPHHHHHRHHHHTESAHTHRHKEGRKKEEARKGKEKPTRKRQLKDWQSTKAQRPAWVIGAFAKSSRQCVMMRMGPTDSKNQVFPPTKKLLTEAPTAMFLTNCNKSHFWRAPMTNWCF